MKVKVKLISKILVSYFLYGVFVQQLQALPLWELGIGALRLNMDHYRGSDQEHSLIFPVPFFIYRGEIIEADASSVNSSIIKKGKFSVSMSFNFGLPVKSKDNRARKDMPDLNPVIEFGPKIVWDIWHDKEKEYFFSFEIPLRLGTAFRKFYEPRVFGSFTVPFLAFFANPNSNPLGVFWSATTAIMYGSKGFHNYYYGVAPEHQKLAHRPTYRAPGGYSGHHWTVYLSKRFGPLQLYSFFRHDNIKNTAFSASPLVRKNSYKMLGVGLMWYFWKSSRKQKSKMMR